MVPLSTVCTSLTKRPAKPQLNRRSCLGCLPRRPPHWPPSTSTSGASRTPTPWASTSRRRRSCGWRGSCACRWPSCGRPLCLRSPRSLTAATRVRPPGACRLRAGARRPSATAAGRPAPACRPLRCHTAHGPGVPHHAPGRSDPTAPLPPNQTAPNKPQTPPNKTQTRPPNRLNRPKNALQETTPAPSAPRWPTLRGSTTTSQRPRRWGGRAFGTSCQVRRGGGRGD